MQLCYEVLEKEIIKHRVWGLLGVFRIRLLVFDGFCISLFCMCFVCLLVWYVDFLKVWCFTCCFCVLHCLSLTRLWLLVAILAFSCVKVVFSDSYGLSVLFLARAYDLMVCDELRLAFDVPDVSEVWKVFVSCIAWC